MPDNVTPRALGFLTVCLLLLQDILIWAYHARREQQLSSSTVELAKRLFPFQSVKGQLAGAESPTNGWASLFKLFRCKVQLVVSQGLCIPAFREWAPAPKCLRQLRTENTETISKTFPYKLPNSCLHFFRILSFPSESKHRARRQPVL